MFVTVELSCTCHTMPGENVYICGSIPELGNWEPAKGMRMYTQGSLYPKWNSYQIIVLNTSQVIEFKLVIINQVGLIKWENGGNRIFKPEMSCIVEINYEVSELKPIYQDICGELCQRWHFNQILEEPLSENLEFYSSSSLSDHQELRNQSFQITKSKKHSKSGGFNFVEKEEDQFELFN